MQEPIPFQIDLDYVSLSGLRWGKGHHQPVLAMHGWLDNCQSFSQIAPLLAEACDLDIWAVDLVGHGHSSHRPKGSYYHIWDNVIDMALLMDAQGWEQVDLLGHSMGAGVATLMAGAIPDRIRRVALIEGLGPLATPADESPQQLSQALGRYRLQGGQSQSDPSQARQSQHHKTKSYKAPPCYATVDEAAKARMKGIGEISYQAALPLTERGTWQDSDGLRWRSDARLRIPSPVRLTEAQVYSFCAAITAPTCLVIGEQGFLVNGDNTPLRKEKVADIQQHILPGNHHLHLELESAPAVAGTLIQFWQNA
ncbi:alpha/beta hydrolase [Oceanospirillum maris]|uniref:alpha/beta hydrolase n=1 Tax=Oceanospirillum maris TaxID=64977 RepID=UPI00040076DD|nr:alpha/beta fold hydrolase [Oceanospirillum maris]